MRQIKILLLFIIFYSCKTDSKAELLNDSERNDTYVMFGLLNQEFGDLNSLLQNQITESLVSENLSENQFAKKYDSLTKQYSNYLENVNFELINKLNNIGNENYTGEFSRKEYINELFFLDNDYSKKGSEFISKTNNYRSEILKLVESENLRKRIIKTLNTNHVLDRDGNKLEYLNYFYEDMPLVAVITFISHKKKCVLEFENEFLKNLELKK